MSLIGAGGDCGPGHKSPAALVASAVAPRAGSQGARHPETVVGSPSTEVAGTVTVGVLVWSQYTTWQELMGAGAAADAAGYDHLWSWDHLVPIKGDPNGPIFEALMTLAGWATHTERVELGPMVAANTFREPAVLVKMITALDHMSSGRAVLGLGGGWFESEHRAYGIPYGRGAAERLGWLDDAAALVRPLLGGCTSSATGDRYTASGVHNDPPPVRRRIPLLVGGGGERRTLATVARYADAWNIGLGLEDARRKVDVLRQWCDAVGRDSGAIRKTIGMGPVVIRDHRSDGEAMVADLRRMNRGWDEHIPVMRPSEITDLLVPYLELGFRGFHIDLPAPYDAQTLERFASEVRPALEAARPIRPVP